MNENDLNSADSGLIPAYVMLFILFAKLVASTVLNVVVLIKLKPDDAAGPAPVVAGMPVGKQVELSSM